MVIAKAVHKVLHGIQLTKVESSNLAANPIWQRAFLQNEHKRKQNLTESAFPINDGLSREGDCLECTVQSASVDVFVIGGGINGCGIARDAAGRGLSVVVAEQGDLAQATSSASTKLFHGGLRYLEYFEFGLVRKALEERETLLLSK